MGGRRSCCCLECKARGKRQWRARGRGCGRTMFLTHLWLAAPCTERKESSQTSCCQLPANNWHRCCDRSHKLQTRTEHPRHQTPRKMSGLGEKVSKNRIFTNQPYLPNFQKKKRFAPSSATDQAMMLSSSNPRQKLCIRRKQYFVEEEEEYEEEEEEEAPSNASRHAFSLSLKEKQTPQFQCVCHF